MKRWLHRALAWFALIGLACAPFVVWAASPDEPPVPTRIAPHPGGPSDPAELASFLDSFIGAQLAAEQIVGAAVAVVQDDRLLVAQGYGYADLEQRTPVIADQTLFATGSTGKLFTWAAVMQLVEQGVLDLDADVNRYLSYLDAEIPPTYAEPVRVRHLFSHTAGFDNVPGIFTTDPQELVSQGLALRALMPERVRPPDELAAYSNFGAALAGVLVEEATHTPIELYLEQQIFTPLGMDSTTLRQPLPAELAARKATGYTVANAAPQAAPQLYVRLPAAGASYATVTDMAQFMRAILNDGSVDGAQIFSAATGRQMREQLFTHDERVPGMAYGIGAVTLNGERILKHNGVMPGTFNSIIALIPERGIGIYAVYNTNGSFAYGDALLQAFVNRYYPAEPTLPNAIADAPQYAAQLAGTYRASNSFAATFAKLMAVTPGSAYADIRLTAARDGTITSVGLGPQPLQWTLIAPDVLRLSDGRQDSYGDLVFSPGADGAPTRLFVANNPFRAYERVPWYAAGGFSAAVLGGSALIFLSALLGWPLAWLIGRKRAPYTPYHPWRAVHWLAGGACALGLLAVPALLFTVPGAIVVGTNPALALRGALLLPLIGGALLLGSVVAAVRTWENPGWGRWWRVHYVVTLLAGGGYLWLLHSWNLLGFRF
jgi:CubicO group peptidase (beta-lactamase class C family)